MRERRDERRRNRCGGRDRFQNLGGDVCRWRDGCEDVGKRKDRVQRQDNTVHIVEAGAVEGSLRWLVVMVSCAVTVHDLLVESVVRGFMYVRRRSQRRQCQAGDEHERRCG